MQDTILLAASTTKDLGLLPLRHQPLQLTLRRRKKELKAKNKAKILAPLLADLSTTTESGINTNMDTSTSEYNPSARELAEADASDSSDFPPDVA